MARRRAKSLEQEEIFSRREMDDLGRQRAITITGSRELRRRESRDLLERYAAPWLGKRYSWLVGGARGLDQWCLEWLLEHTEDCWAVLPFLLNDQPREVRPLIAKVPHLIELRLPKSRAAYIKRNHVMVDHCAVVIGFWKRPGGTLATLLYALKSGREVHAYRAECVE